MEFLPILHDFVPYRGRCPATIEVIIEKTIKETVEQGKGTGDHLMPLGDWLILPSQTGRWIEVVIGVIWNYQS